MQNLEEVIENNFYDLFLPMIIDTKNAPKNSTKFRIWSNGNGRSVITLAAPPKLKTDENAKKERLRKVSKRLWEIARMDLNVKIEIAKKVIKKLIEATDGKIAVAFSGGKDSLVALHITMDIVRKPTVLFVDTTVEFPETKRYIQQLSKKWRLKIHVVRATDNYWKIVSERGLPVGGRGNNFFLKELAKKAGVKLSNACCYHLKEKPARDFYKRNNIKGVVTGIRAAESVMRKFNLADYGAIRYSSIYDTLVAWPLFAWTSNDINEYIERYSLPYKPLYDMGYTRIGCWACLQDFFHKDSRLFVLRERHPKMYETLKNKFGRDLVKLLLAAIGINFDDVTSQQLDNLYIQSNLAKIGRKPKNNRRYEIKPDVDEEISIYQKMLSNPHLSCQQRAALERLLQRLIVYKNRL